MSLLSAMLNQTPPELDGKVQRYTDSTKVKSVAVKAAKLTPRQIQARNKARILELIGQGVNTVKTLAPALGMAGSQVSRYTDELVAEGLILKPKAASVKGLKGRVPCILTLV